MVQIFNSMFKKEVLSRSSYFLDVYKLTSTEAGENNKIAIYELYNKDLKVQKPDTDTLHLTI